MQRVLLGMLKQHRSEPIGRIEVAGEERNRASALAQRVAKRERMASYPCLLYVGLDNLRCLVGKSEQPENPRLEVARCHTLIELKPSDTRLVLAAA